MATTTKYIIFTGGVVSSVGKGVTAAALGRTLKERGFSVAVQKLDPYINVDPGTMSPYQHGRSSCWTTAPRRTWTWAIMSASLTSA